MEKGKLFSGNTLKIIGCIFMLIDHIGLFLLPNVAILRYIGRIAYPIFAFMLAEGCTFTKNRLKHFLLIFGMAIIIQVVYFLAIKDYSFSIFLVFSISIILIYLYDYIINNTINIKESTNKTKF